MKQWINIEDQLPEVGETVVVLLHDGSEMESELDENNNFNIEGDDTSWRNIKYWREI